MQVLLGLDADDRGNGDPPLLELDLDLLVQIVKRGVVKVRPGGVQLLSNELLDSSQSRPNFSKSRPHLGHGVRSLPRSVLAIWQIGQ